MPCAAACGGSSWQGEVASCKMWVLLDNKVYAQSADVSYFIFFSWKNFLGHQEKSQDMWEESQAFLVLTYEYLLGYR